MFVVPGWSVSTSELKLQTEPAAATHSTPANNTEGDSPPERSSKRKRKHGGDSKVTKANVDEMWRKHIEGHDVTGNGPSKSKKQKKKERKPAVDVTSATDNSKVNDISNAEPKVTGHSDAPRKKRKQNSSPSTSKELENQANSAPPAPAAQTLTPLQKAMRDKLVSARFRHLNETLYTTPSTQAFELFTSSPELFTEYHAGFSRQVKESWPSNPVDDYIRSVKTRGALRPLPKGRKLPENGPAPLPRRPNGICTIVDLGCGDAQFARALTPVSKLKLKIMSFDLHEGDPLITKADISALPLEDGTADIAIFCLSLMGTNWVSFVEEAWRVLRSDGKGECWVSEVKSRFGKVKRKTSKTPIGTKNKAKKKRKNADGDESDVGDEIFAEDVQTTQNDNDETDISAFVEVFRTRGFVPKPQSVDKSNKMFVKMEFTKHGQPIKGKWAGAAISKGVKKRFLEPVGNDMTPEEESQVLKPCVYKIR